MTQGVSTVGSDGPSYWLMVSDASFANIRDRSPGMPMWTKLEAFSPFV